MTLSTEQQILIEQRIANAAKSPIVAYFLWFFLGTLGAHRFYLGRTGTAVAQLGLTLFGIVTSFVVIGIFILIPVGIWVLVDAFLIPGILNEQKEQLRAQLIQASA